jgi:triacylglycerol lipase
VISQRIKAGTRIFKGTIKEIGAYLVAAQLYPVGMYEGREKHLKHPRKIKEINPCPIILVHGIIHNRSAFVRLKRRMEKRGWINVFTLNYSTFHGNIFQMVEELTQKVEKVRKQTGSSQVDIVAHSLGGIVARTYMSLGEGRGNVRKLVTLGTPHQGTLLSFMAKGLSRGALDADLKINSYLMRLLNQTEIPRSSEITSIYSPFDWTVVPAANGHVTGRPAKKFKNIKLDFVGHMGLLYSTESFDAVVRALLKS